MAAKRVGIRDVALAAGVSVTTVSHVLNETPYARTSLETRERVRSAATQLGYKPNTFARGLRTQSSEMIGLLTEEIATTPHAGGIIRGAQDAAKRHSLTLAIINSDLSDDASAVTEDVSALLDRHVDGIIYATVFHDEVSPPETMYATPAVLIGARDRRGLIPSVVPDERDGARRAIESLVRLGHRRIGFVNRSDDVPATRGRAAGYADALEHAGLGMDACIIASEEAEARGGYAGARQLLCAEDPPTAIFCYNDRMAMGVYRAAAELGLRVPSDLSIVGFDNQEPLPGSLFPELTTVALPHHQMGGWAVDTLIDLIEGRREEALLAGYPTRLACELVERSSTAPPSR